MRILNDYLVFMFFIFKLSLKSSRTVLVFNGIVFGYSKSNISFGILSLTIISTYLVVGLASTSITN